MRTRFEAGPGGLLSSQVSPEHREQRNGLIVIQPITSLKGQRETAYCKQNKLGHNHIGALNSLRESIAHTQSIPVTGQLVLLCFAFWRLSFIQGKICLVMTGVAVLEPVVLGDFFFCVELLLGLGELAAKGAACCCSLILSVWLLPWLALGRIQTAIDVSIFMCWWPD